MSAPPSDGEASVRYTTKELLAELDRAMDRLADEVRDGHRELAGRLLDLQQQTTAAGDALRRLPALEVDVARLSEQLAVHRSSLGHDRTLDRLGVVETWVRDLDRQGVRGEAEVRYARWLTITFISAAGALVGVAAVLRRLLRA